MKWSTLLVLLHQVGGPGPKLDTWQSYVVDGAGGLDRRHAFDSQHFFYSRHFFDSWHIFFYLTFVVSLSCLTMHSMVWESEAWLLIQCRRPPPLCPFSVGRMWWHSVHHGPAAASPAAKVASVNSSRSCLAAMLS